MSACGTEHKTGSQSGFTIIELVIVFIVTALLLVPLLKLAISSVGGTRDQQTQTALETAAESLISYAASNGGCLPFAADFEGGLPDTNAAGGFLADTGVGKVNTYAGDLPWADLGLANRFLDGDWLRLQYYVARPYAGDNCRASFRGFEYHANVDYLGALGPGNAVYVYYGAGPNRELYEITGPYLAGTVPPKEAPVNVRVKDVTKFLDTDILEVRRGPDVTSAGAESDEMSKRNVFVLIAPGTNRNADLNRAYVRDSNHTGDESGGPWPLNASDPPVTITAVRFSLTHNIDATDRGSDGDDTLLVMSFVQYKARLMEFGLNMEPICEQNC